MDGPGDYYAKWDNLVRERYSIWSHSYVESNQQNNLTNKIETEAQIHRTYWQLSEGRGLGAGIKKVMGLMKKYVYMTHTHGQQYGDSHRVRR